MDLPADRKYTATHEWYKADGNIVTVGITQFAADELTDITYVELPEVGAAVKVGTVGEIESVKATADLNCAISGKVVEVNTALSDRPELLNEDAFGEGWILKIEAADTSLLSGLMDAATYQKKI